MDLFSGTLSEKDSISYNQAFYGHSIHPFHPFISFRKCPSLTLSPHFCISSDFQFSVAVLIAQSRFAPLLIRWQKQHGRHRLPWQNTNNAYFIWLSEIMLQQTQVATVIPYYDKFIRRFPDVSRLARAREDSVLAMWSGLGYYSRARNLHKTAKTILFDYGGNFPRDVEQIKQLPGIGPSTAAAICVFSFNQHHAILDGNVKRVLTRVFGICGDVRTSDVHKTLMSHAESLLPQKEIKTYTQGLMDLGATCCLPNRPNCTRCPFKAKCLAHQTGQIADFPGKSPKKQKPVKSAILVMYRSQDELLFVKRPPKGVWASLWSLPEYKSLHQLKKSTKKYSIENKQMILLPSFRHTFTHFHLDIQPVAIILQSYQKDQLQFTSKSKWVRFSQWKKLGTPAAVEKCLRPLGS